MKIFFDLKEDIPKVGPIAITIGNFDGLHLGHQAIFKRLKTLTKENNGITMVVTFVNHPSSILRPSAPVKTLCTWPHKCRLLEEQGIDTVLALEFTQAFSQLTAQQFLSQLYESYSFSHLVLGQGALMGRERQGNHTTVLKLAEEYQFQVEYLANYQVDGITVSSSLVREQLRLGHFSEVAKLLGREYSIYAPVISGQGKGRLIGFPTVNIDVTNLVLPPQGVYAVTVTYRNEEIQAIANLGVAPTLRADETPLLEVHFFDQNRELHGQEIEVKFVKFIRPEIKFDNLNELKQQIQADIQQAKTLSGKTTKKNKSNF